MFISGNQTTQKMCGVLVYWCICNAKLWVPTARHSPNVTTKCRPKNICAWLPTFLCHNPQNITLREVQYFTTIHNFRTLHFKPKFSWPLCCYFSLYRINKCYSVDKKNQLDVTFCILYFSSNSCSTCFGQPCAHHQELTTAWCYSLVLVCAVAAGRLSSPVGR